MKRVKHYHNLDLDDLLNLEQLSPSKQIPIRASTPLAAADASGHGSSSSSDESEIIEFAEEMPADEIPADSDHESDVVECLHGGEILEAPFWHAAVDEVSLFKEEDVEMLLLSLQCIGRLTDRTMELITIFLSSLLPRNCEFRGLTYGRILENILGRASLSDPSPLINYFCSKCFTSMSALFDICKKPSCSLVNVKQHAGAFVCFRLQPQLEKIIGSAFSDMQRFISVTACARESDCVGDVITGQSYANYGLNPDEDGTFFISLIMSADGACAFKSTTSSLWPCDGMVVELPPKQRCMFENVVTFGFWIGRLDSKKPQWELFLPTILEELRFLNSVGFLTEINGRMQRVKVRLHATIFDSPALASAWSIKQYNGAYGCVRCQHPGERRNGVMLYPKRFDILKKDSQFYEAAWMAIDGGKEHHCVHARPPLSVIANPATHHVIDPMHMIYLGNARAIFMKLFIGKTGEPAVISKALAKNLGQLIPAIRFPHDFTRKIPPLANLLTYKATELKNLLLYAILPLTSAILGTSNPNLWHWIAIFVEAIRILSQHSCLIDDVNRARQLIDVWQLLLPEYLGVSSQTYNAHVVQHLPDQVWNFGSLWSVSEFPFEGFNGLYTRMVKSGKGIAQQLARRVSLSKIAFSWIRAQRKNTSPVSSLLLKLFPGKMKLYDTVAPVQLLDVCSTITSEFIEQVEAYFGDKTALVTYGLRAVVNGNMFHSTLHYKKLRHPTASCLVVLRNDDQQFIYGEIITFLSCEEDVFLLYNKFDVIGDLLDYISPPTEKNLKRLYDLSLYGNIFKRVRPSGKVFLCSPDDILYNFVLIHVEDASYAVDVLPYEHD